MDGVRTPNLTEVSVADEVIANRAGSTVLVPVDSLAAQLAASGPIADAISAAGTGPAYETRAQLYADLNWKAGSVGRVYGDSTEAYRGVYVKLGSSGSGSWLRIGPLPGGDTSGMQAEIDAVEAGLAAETTARIKGDIRRLNPVAGTANAITGTVNGTLSAFDLFLLVPNAGNNTGAVTLNINGTGAFPLIDEDGQPLVANALDSGRAYILRASGGPVDAYRLVTGAITFADVAARQPVDTLLTVISALSATAGSLPPDGTGYVLVFNPTTFTFSAVLADDIGGKPLLNRFDEPATVGTSLTEIVREGKDLREVVLANKSDTATINIVNAGQTLPLGPGAIASLDGLPPGKTFAFATEAGAPLFCRIGTKATSSPNAILRAERLIKRHSANRDISLAKRLAWQDFYVALDAADILRKSLYLFVMNTYDMEAAMLDWGPHAGVGVPVNGPISFSPYTGPYFNGTTQHVLTGRKWSDNPAINALNLAQMVFAGSTENGATRATLSSGDAEIQANRSTTSHGFANSSTSVDSATGSSVAGMLRHQRTNDEAKFSATRNNSTLIAEFLRTARETLFDFEHVIAAHTGSSGPNNAATHWTGTVKMAWAGEPLTQAQWTAIYQGFGTFTAAMEAA